MQKLTCKTCTFSEFEVSERAGTALRNDSLGCCRKNPPVPLIVMQRNPLTHETTTGIQPVFPLVFGNDWCGSGSPKPASVIEH